MITVPVTWDGMDLNLAAEDDRGILRVVEDVTGWYDSPPYDGRDATFVLMDGAQRGPKTAGPRDIVITGVGLGSRSALALFRDDLIVRAAAASPADLVIIDGAGRAMTARVRADSDAFKHTFSGPTMFRYQLTVTATDPRLYGPYQSVTLNNLGDATTGWKYDHPATGGPDPAVPATWDAPIATAAGVTGQYTAGAFLVNCTTAPAVAGGGASVTFVGVATINVPCTADIPAGARILLTMTTNAGAGTVTVTDSNGTAYAQRAWTANSTSAQRSWLFYATAPSPGMTAGNGWISITTTTLVEGAATFAGLTGAGDIGASDYARAISGAGAVASIPTGNPRAPWAGSLAFVMNGAKPGTPGDPPGFTRVVAANGTASLVAASMLWYPPKIVRVYPRQYAGTIDSNEAVLLNQGNVPAPVHAAYIGDLTQSRLVALASGRTINVAALQVGETINVDTSTLVATAPGGESRASYVLAGSQTLLVAPQASDVWSLYAAGGGSVTLTWRSAWQ